MSDRGDLPRLKELIDSICIGLLTTVDLDGSLHTRPVETLRCDADGTLWFFTDHESPKAHELSHDMRVSVGYSDASKNGYVAVAGRARVLRDRVLAADLWKPGQRAWYPKGVDDEHLSILRVAIERAEYWETPGRASYLLAAMVAAVTGKPATVGQSKKLP
ncbi:MAG TPA: pyridoxamine 5'-phosphate oxidase family protein [Steroidobacteraceae bacterium]|jgi:general stress protein 26|nr:pyridoxamine 5'-phosphate oxidase family protein [Steroidobacteraceae bacterium]